MTSQQYYLYKKRYDDLLQILRLNGNRKDIVIELEKVTFDDPHKEIEYSGNRIEKIIGYFPLSVLTDRRH